MPAFIDLTKNAFLKMLNKDTLTFLIFVALSSVFWLFNALNEDYEQDFDIAIDTRNVPKDVILTEEPPKTIRITIKDKGGALIHYKFGGTLPKFTLDKQLFLSAEGHVRLLSADIVKQLRGNFSGSNTSIVSVKPDTIDIFYNHGRSRRVPVVVVGTPKPSTGYTITGTRVKTDSVNVYVASSIPDTIRAAYVRVDKLTDIAKQTTFNVGISRTKGVKFAPALVQVSVGADRLVEKKITVPVRGFNVPEGKQLRAFPSQVEVVFHVGMSNYRDVTAEMFEVVADFEHLPTDGSARCPLTLRKWPGAAKHVRLSQTEVEYLIENQAAQQ